MGNVGLMGSLRRSFLDICFLDPLVNFKITPVVRIITPNLGAIVVRRVADDDADGLFVLLRNAEPVTRYKMALK